jgi:hypothetical protein
MKFNKKTPLSAFVLLTLVFASACSSSKEVDPQSQIHNEKQAQLSPSHSDFSLSSAEVLSGKFIQITLRLKDTNGNLFLGDHVPIQLIHTGGTSTGTFAPLINHHDGTYTTQFTGIRAGTPTFIQATVNNNKLTSSNPQIQVKAGAPSATNSFLKISDSKIKAGSQSTVTLTLVDENGNHLTQGKQSIQLTTSDGAASGPDSGNFIAMKDLGNGTYTAQFTGKVAGTTTLKAKIGNQSTTTSSQKVEVTPGKLDFTQAFFQSSSSSVDAGSQTSITFKTTDAYGNQIKSPGHAVTFSLQQGTGLSTGTLGPVKDNGDGTYTAQLTGHQTGTPALIHVQVDGKNPSTTFKAQVNPGSPSIDNSEIQVDTSHVKSGSKAQITVKLKDAFKNTVKQYNHKITFSHSSNPGESTGTFEPALYTFATGTFTSSFTGIRTGTPTTVYVHLDGKTITSSTPTIQVNIGPLSGDQSEAKIDETQVSSGASTKIKLTLKDINGNTIDGSQHQTLALSHSSNSGESTGNFDKLSYDANSNIFNSQFTGIRAGTPTTIQITPTEGTALKTKTHIKVIPSAPSANQSEVTVSKNEVKSGSTIQVSLKLKDLNGNIVTESRPKVTFSHSDGKSTGTFSKAINNNGIYTSNFTGVTAGAPTTIQAQIDGHEVSSLLPTVTVLPGSPSAEQSTLTPSSKKISPKTQTQLTLTLKDKNGNEIKDGAYNIRFSLNKPKESEGFLSSTINNQNGTFNVTFHAGNQFSEHTVSAYINGYSSTNLTSKISVELVAFFGVDRKSNYQLPPVQARTKGVIKNFSGNNSLSISQKALEQCAGNYNTQWPGTETIISSHVAHKSSSCWNSDQLAEIQDLRNEITHSLSQLQNRRGHTDSKDLENNQALLQKVGNGYQKLQEYLSYCRLHDVLKNEPQIQALPIHNPVEINSDDKALLHVVGDAFGKKSGLEGQNSVEEKELLEKRLAVIDTMSKILQHKKYIQSELQAHPCEKIQGGYHPENHGSIVPLVDFRTEFLNDIQNHGQQALRIMNSKAVSLDQFIRTLNEEFNNSLKKDGDWLYFMGGSIDHAIIYQITYQAKHNKPAYIFRVFNSGGGSNFHASILDGVNRLTYPYIEKSEVSREAVLRISFLKAIRDLEYADKSRPNSKMAFIYDNIYQELEGKTTTPTARTEDFLTTQFAGNCSYFVLPYMQQAIMKNDLTVAAQLEFFIKSKIMDSYIRLNEKRIQSFDPLFRLTSQSLTYYSEEVAKNISTSSSATLGRKSHYVDWGMAQESFNQVQFYNEIIKAGSNLRNNKREKAAPQFTSKDLLTILKENFPTSWILSLSSIREQKQFTPLKNPIDIESWDVKAGSLNQDLENFFKELKPITSESSEDRPREVHKILEAVQTIAKKIPLEQTFFKNLDSNQLSTFLALMDDLSQQHFWALVNLHSTPTSDRLGLSPTQILTQVKLLSLTQLAINLYSQTRQGALFNDFPSLYNNLFEFFVLPKGKNSDQWASVLAIEDWEWAKEFEKLKDFWIANQKSTHNKKPTSIFEWHKLPLYSSSGPYNQKRIVLRTSSNDYFNTNWSTPFGYPQNLGWADIKWVHSKLKTNDPYASYTNAIRAIERESAFLPDTFFEIRDVSFITHYILTGSFHSKILSGSGIRNALISKDYFLKNHNQRVSLPFGFYKVEPYDKTAIITYDKSEYRFFGIQYSRTGTDLLEDPQYRLKQIYTGSTWFDTLYTGNPNFQLELNGERNQLGPWSKIIESREHYYQVASSDKIEIPYYKRLSSPDIISSPQIKYLPSSDKKSSKNNYETHEVAISTLEMQRQLLNLGSPSVTLAYFKEHPHYLQEKRWQVLFKALIFQPELLFIEHKKNPRFQKSLSEFLWKSYELRFKDDDYLAAGFFARMYQLAQEFAPETIQKEKPIYSARQAFQAILGKLSQPISDTKNLIFRDLIRTYKHENFNHLSTEEIKIFIEAVIYRDRNALQSGESFETDEENGILGIYSRKLGSLVKKISNLTENERNLIFNQIISAYADTQNTQMNWQSTNENLIWKAQDLLNKSEYQIDIARPLILNDGFEERVLPGVISNLERFKTMVHWNPTKHPYVKWLGGQRYELRDENNVPVRIDAGSGSFDSGSLKIEKKWGNYWYQLLEDDEVNSLVFDESGYWSLMPGYHNYQRITQGSTSSMNSTTDFIFNKDGNPTDPKWANWDTLENRGTEILAFDPSEKFLYSVSRTDKKTTLVQKVRYHDKKALIDGTTLYSLNNIEITPYHFLSRIEIPRMIWIWKDSQDKFIKAELPRFGISFQEKEGQLVSPELENYEISEKQFFSGLGDYPHYLVVQKSEKKRLLVPRFQFANRQKEKSLVVHYDLKWYERSASEKNYKPTAIDAYGRNSQRLLVWAIDPFSQQIKVSEAEDRFYLAMIHLWDHSPENRSYDHARDLLFGNRSELEDYGSNLSGAREILNWIVSLKNADHDPRAIALRLGASFLIVENNLSNYRYGTAKIDEQEITVPEILSDDTQIFPIMKEIYSYFLDTKEKIAAHWLPEDLEILYLETLRSTLTKQFDNRHASRLAELKGEALMPISVHPGTNPADLKSYQLSYSDIINIIQYDSCRSTYSSSNNLFNGHQVSFDQLYQISIDLNYSHFQSQWYQSLFVSQLEKLLNVKKESLKSLKSDQLKEEYLSFLRLMIRQAEIAPRRSDSSALSESTRMCASFLYALAISQGNKSSIPTLAQLKSELTAASVDFHDGYNRRVKVTDYFLNAPLDLNSVDWSFLKGSTAQTATLDTKEKLGTLGNISHFWDPRKESQPKNVPSENKNHAKPVVLELRKNSGLPKDTLYDLTKNSVLLQSEIKAYVEEHELGSLERVGLTQSKDQLRAVFDAVPIESTYNQEHEKFDLFIQKALQKTQSLFDGELAEKYYSSIKSYHWKNLDLSPVRAKLQQSSNDALNYSQLLEVDIESKIHEIPAQAWNQAKETIFSVANVEERPTLKRLIQAYATKSLEQLSFVNSSSYNSDRGKNLKELITSYLIATTFHFRVQEVISALDQVNTAIKNKIDPSSEDLQRFYQTATQLRAYPISEHPDYLAFEYSMRGLIRQDQVHNLSLLTQDKNTLLEMNMGAGKTSVLLPLASHQNAIHEQQLSIVVLPEALVPSMVKQLSQQLEQVFGQGVDRLTIQRKNKYDLDKLQYLYSRLRKDLEQKKVVVTSNSSIQSLFLIFIESLTEYENLQEFEKPKRKQEIITLQNIFSLFRNKGHVIIDEVDSILDIMASHRFSVGHRQPLEPSIINAAIGLYKLLSEASNIHQKVKIPFIQAVYPKAAPFGRDTYETVRDDLINLVCRPESAAYFFDQPELVSLFKSLDMKEMKTYFHSQDRKETTKYIQSLPHDTIKDVISVLFTEIHQTLPMTLDKSYLVHYGLCPGDPDAKGDIPAKCDPFIGIPYHSGSPVLTSRFGTDLESLNYTIQSHLERRNIIELFKIEIEKLRTQFRKNKNKVIRDKIMKYFPGKNLSDGSILNLDDHAIANQAKIISNTYPHLVLDLVKTYAAPKIEVFLNQLFTNSHIYPVLFKKVQGMSGTLWNHESFPEFYQKIERADAMIRTFTSFLKNPETSKVKVIETPRSDHSTLDILKMMHVGREKSSIIDQGGFFRGRDNQSVVEALFELPGHPTLNSHEKTISQFIYYDQNHQLQIMRSDAHGKKIRPYIAQETDRMETGAFWDMQHTTGSDLKVHPKAQAILTLSKFSTTRDLLQAAWRLRELDRAQSVILIITRDDLKIISKVLTDVYGKSYALDIEANEISLKDVLLYLETNQTMKVAEVVYRSVKASQKAIVVDSVFDTLVTSEVGDELFLALKKVSRFFSSPRGEHPHKRYGIPIVQTSTFEFLKSEISRVFSPVRELFSNVSKLVEDFETALQGKKDLLRQKVRTILNLGDEADKDTDEEMEIEAENEAEQEEEQEQEQELAIQEIDARYKKPLLKWNEEKFKDGTVFSKPTQFTDISKFRMSKNQLSALSPIISFHDVLKLGKIEKYSHLFDPNLLGSLNLFPIFRSDFEANDIEFKPFQVYQDMLDHLLVLFNPESDQIKVVMITRDEALEDIGDWLTHLPIKVDGHHALIYQFGNGIIRGSMEVKEEVLAMNPKFQQLYVQIKFLSGRLDYIGWELDALNAWASQDKKRTELFELFQEILKYKDTSRENFEHSVLYEVLTQKH